LHCKVDKFTKLEYLPKWALPVERMTDVRGLRLYMKHDRMLTKHYLCESKHFYKTGSSNSEVDVALCCVE